MCTRRKRRWACRCAWTWRKHHAAALNLTSNTRLRDITPTPDTWRLWHRHSLTLIKDHNSFIWPTPYTAQMVWAGTGWAVEQATLVAAGREWSCAKSEPDQSQIRARSAPDQVQVRATKEATVNLRHMLCLALVTYGKRTLVFMGCLCEVLVLTATFQMERN